MDVNSVFLKDMPFMLSLEKDAWQRKDKVQPVNITFRVDQVHSIDDAAVSDDVSKSLDYGKLYKDMQRYLEGQGTYPNIRAIALVIVECANPSTGTCFVQLDLPKAALRAEGGLRYTVKSEQDSDSTTCHDTFHIQGIRCACIIGVNPHERRDKQMVIINLTFTSNFQPFRGAKVDTLNLSPTDMAINRYHQIIDTVTKRVEVSSYQTVEALAITICRDITMQWLVPEVEVSVEKPYAIPSIGAAGVCIRRRKSIFERSNLGKREGDEEEEKEKEEEEGRREE